MTDVKIFKLNGNITCVEASGHTGYGVQGEDIVCAALSSIIQTAVLGVLTVAGVNAKLDKNDKTGYIKLTLPTNLDKTQQRDVKMILNTMLVGISDLRETYSDFIDLEVVDDVY